MAARPACIALMLAAAASAFAGYGDAVNGRPSKPERDMTVATNAVRADPRGFRDAYIGVDTILLAANYRAVNPLYHYSALDEAARNHADDMAANHGISHFSSDGTTFQNRVTPLYTGWNYIGENVATGISDGLGTVVQLLRDDIYPTDHPASDSSDHDGHRKNIMTPYFTETGAGYAYSANRAWYHFWCQDFGRRFSPAANTRIPAGSHFELNTGTFSYLVNYFDTEGNAPQSVSVIINGTPHTMALHLGTTDRGTWKYDTADTGYKTRYWFECIDAAGSTTRYPATDTLYANPGEDDPPAGITTGYTTGNNTAAITVSPFPATSQSVITMPGNTTSLRIYNGKGQLIKELRGSECIHNAFTGLPGGLYLLQQNDTNGHTESQSIPLIK